MTALSTSFISFTPPHSQFSASGSSLKPTDLCLLSADRSSKAKLTVYKTPFTVRASSDRARPSSAGIFIGGFVLGGIVVGTLGCVFAPQISKALAGADRKDLMRKLPKFIYDEEKALEVRACLCIYHLFHLHLLSMSEGKLGLQSVASNAYMYMFQIGNVCP